MIASAWGAHVKHTLSAALLVNEFISTRKVLLTEINRPLLALKNQPATLPLRAREIDAALRLVPHFARSFETSESGPVSHDTRATAFTLPSESLQYVSRFCRLH
jgi:hypothetical protein